ncbi:MAG: SDR family oxidoreductase [Candidatus Heimdallarchaeaceae archaeon]
MHSREQTVVLLVGASRGIGRTTAEFLQRKGYKVYGTTRNLSQVEKTSFEMIELDVTKDDTVERCIQQILDKEGRIDVLINNAGFALCGALKDITVEELKQQFETNFFGVHRMITKVLPHMLERKEGRLINIGTLGGRVGLPFQAAYSTSKAALANYTDSLRMELMSYNIKVSLIEPGDTKTNFHSSRVYAKGFENDKIAKQTVELMHKSEMSGSNPQKVSKNILKAIKKKNPRPRYTSGLLQTFLLSFVFRLFTIKLQHWGLMLYYKIPKKMKG